MLDFKSKPIKLERNNDWFESMPSMFKRMYPHAITVINKFDNRGKVEYYYRAILGVHYQDKQGVVLGSTERYTSDQGYVQIPYASIKDYLPYEKWRELEDKSQAWTLQREDYIVKGIPDTTIFKDIKEKRTIESYENIDYSIIIDKHLGVSLK